MNPVVTVFEPAEALKHARAIVFDFDGTLVDSNPIKRRAFELCFSEFAEQRKDILAYCGAHHHTPRGDKFRYVYEQILRQPYTPRITRQLHTQFEMATTQQIIEAAEIRGATAFLNVACQTHQTALLSSTPHQMLLTILEGRGWRRWFTTVQGAPVQKANWLRRFRTSHGFSASELIFFGDSQEDADAAQTAGCLFIQIGTDSLLAEDRFHVADFMNLVRNESHCDPAKP